ncbi:MAG: hypothetical protein DRJ50_03160 [Actinobacteria bacterium]|nr:MAG: hypothetical protein DRJ50_03160 [Actinomycetota bacterium]
MAEKRYKLTAAVVASPQYQQQNQYQFKVRFQLGVAPPLVVCDISRCPVIACTENDVLGTTNVWAQASMDEMIIAKSLIVNGVNHFGVPGSLSWEETADPVTIDLDTIFPSS